MKAALVLMFLATPSLADQDVTVTLPTGVFDSGAIATEVVTVHHPSLREICEAAKDADVRDFSTANPQIVYGAVTINCKDFKP